MKNRIAKRMTMISPSLTLAISAKAKAVYALLCSCPEGSDRSIKSLAAKLDMRRETASHLISELENYGYVERTRIRGPDGKHFVTDFRIYPRSSI